MSSGQRSLSTDLMNDLNEALESNQESVQVNFEIQRYMLNLSSLEKVTSNPERLLLNIKRLLIESPSDSELDFELILELLSTLMNKCSFEDVLQTFSVDDLKMSLKSNILPLVNAACKVISKSYPKGIFANSELLDIMLGLYFDVDTEVSVLNSIEKVLRELSSDELVRKRVFENNLPMLIAVKKGSNTTLLSRLLELLTIESEFIDRNEYNKKLFTFTSDEIFKFLAMDIVLFINTLVYYTNLLKESSNVNLGGKNHQWMLKYVIEIIPIFGNTYAQREIYPDIKYFGRSYLFNFFKHISYLNDGIDFKALDEDYLKIYEQQEYFGEFLSFVNPAYLFKYYSSLLKEYITVTPTKLGVIRNILSDSQCFQLIKDKLTSDSILLLPYMEQMVLLQRISNFRYSVQYLVHSLPRVMSNLIQYPESITEPETVALRRETIVNLLGFESSMLNIWYIPLTDSLAKIDGPLNGNTTKAQVASSFI